MSYARSPRPSFVMTVSSICLLVLQVGGVEELLLRPFDLLPRPHDLDELLPSLRRADHDRANQSIVFEEEFAVELLLQAERADRLQAGLDIGRHAHHRQ